MTRRAGVDFAELTAVGRYRAAAKTETRGGRPHGHDGANG